MRVCTCLGPFYWHETEVDLLSAGRPLTLFLTILISDGDESSSNLPENFQTIIREIYDKEIKDINDIDQSVYSFWHEILNNTDNFCKKILNLVRYIIILFFIVSYDASLIHVTTPNIITWQRDDALGLIESIQFIDLPLDLHPVKHEHHQQTWIERNIPHSTYLVVSDEICT